MLKKTPRHRARQLAIQGSYYYRVNLSSVREIEEFLQVSCEAQYKLANYELLHFLLEHSTNQFEAMLQLYTKFIHRKITEVNMIEQAILVLAAVELVDNHSVPTAVIINEAVELAKVYGSEDSYKFINSSVDQLAKHIRGK